MTKFLPLLLALLGLGGGAGAGYVLRPSPEVAQASMPCGDPGAEAEGADADKEGCVASSGPAEEPVGEGVFVRFDQNFVIPLIANGEVAAMVVMNLTLEVDPGIDARVLEREPRIRDRFLRVMLDHAGAGGFDGVFTSNGRMDRLKTALIETANREIGPGLRDVLILDLNKQAV
ncbi:Flagellar basal body-associated protein FliL [Palleronia marisminoris]|uniref:Uncharacterized protein n=1 Tax=Palleronia marisminoris TaxID=315423 RepID=A0A1Y5SUX8_9RHOB|nr:flagellar basal body-associated FliL family protein [Palleronia marisminoris]SFG95604.1 Flagellar basal body-associated protein FliL [Palleronia marisminoris]SLN47064.1 hypothetical protein PAM7066_02064 [Palleronia marisminoris]